MKTNTQARTVDICLTNLACLTLLCVWLIDDFNWNCLLDYRTTWKTKKTSLRSMLLRSCFKCFARLSRMIFSITNSLERWSEKRFLAVKRKPLECRNLWPICRNITICSSFQRWFEMSTSTMSIWRRTQKLWINRLWPLCLANMMTEKAWVARLMDL